MKIVGVSNFDDESVAQTLIAENVPKLYTEVICKALNAKFSGDTATYFYRAFPDDYRLWRGMADIVGDD